MNPQDPLAPTTTTIAAADSPSVASPPPSPAVATPTGLDQLAERMLRELLRDRRSERRWRIFFRLAWFGLVLALAWGLLAQRVHHAGPTGPHTALVEVQGELASDTEANAEQLLAGLRSAFEEPHAVAVVLRINSPGGSPVQAGIVNDEIRRLKQRHGKKVYAVVEEVCASGAYYIAAAADEIFVDKASLVGSIGVLMDGFGFDGLMGKLGVERRLLTAGANKGMLDPFSPQNERHRVYAQTMIDQIHQQFIQVVREGRGARLKETPETFSGLFWNGEEAVRNGLADRLGSLDLVARDVVKAEEVIDYTQRENVAEKLAKRFGASVVDGALRAAGALPRLR